MRLVLIRHGRSIANEQKLVTGTATDPLSSTGIAQALALRDWLKEMNIIADYYVTSQWKRAQETANILFPDVSWKIESRIGETNAGVVADWPLDTFLSQYPDFYQNHHSKYPQGESHSELYTRSTRWFEEMVMRTNKSDTVILVAHSGPISCILQYISSIPMENFPAFIPMNTSVSVVEVPNKILHEAKLIAFSAGPNPLFSFLSSKSVNA